MSNRIFLNHKLDNRTFIDCYEDWNAFDNQVSLIRPGIRVVSLKYILRRCRASALPHAHPKTTANPWPGFCGRSSSVHGHGCRGLLLQMQGTGIVHITAHLGHRPQWGAAAQQSWGDREPAATRFLWAALLSLTDTPSRQLQPQPGAPDLPRLSFSQPLSLSHTQDDGPVNLGHSVQCLKSNGRLSYQRVPHISYKPKHMGFIDLYPRRLRRSLRLVCWCITSLGYSGLTSAGFLHISLWLHFMCQGDRWLSG